MREGLRDNKKYTRLYRSWQREEGENIRCEVSKCWRKKYKIIAKYLNVTKKWGNINGTGMHNLWNPKILGGGGGNITGTGTHYLG